MSQAIRDAEHVVAATAVREAFDRHGMDGLAGDWIERFTTLVVDLAPLLRLSFEDVADGLAIGAKRWWPGAS